MDMENKPSKLKAALNYGALYGLVLLIINLISYILEMYDSVLMTIVGIVVGIGGLVYGIKKYRDDICDGFISYKSALGYGVLVVLFSGIIVNTGNYIYWSYDSSFIEYKLEQETDKMYNKGMTDEQIEQSLPYVEMFMKPGIMSIMAIFFNVLFGFILSLIIAAFLKKDPELFDQT